MDRPFRISRGSRTEARVILVAVTDGNHVGRGEAAPSKRYNTTGESVTAQLREIFPKIAAVPDRKAVNELVPPGAARNALDCALWDLEAKRSGKRAWEMANISVASEVSTAFTISLDTPEAMAENVRSHQDAPILKLKLTGDDLDLPRVEAVRREAPNAQLLIDANEAWSAAHYEKIVPALARLGVVLIEQPFPADQDAVLEELQHPIPVCADESCHTTGDLARLKKRYEAINVKLDKTGGLTEALRLTETARAEGFKILFGCMVCTSLAIAPARILAQTTDYVDLDGPLLLGKDRTEGLHYDHGKVGLPSPKLWG